MSKKRLIFTLLYNQGSFMLSRNFRLQRAGDIGWLKNNYNFKNIAFFIDELIILDVSRGEHNLKQFCDHVKMIGEQCFIPIAAGGGITSCENAKTILNSGADKIVLNTALFAMPCLVKELVAIYGSQCIIASIDVRKEKSGFQIYIKNGSTKLTHNFTDYINQIIDLQVGEIYLNSIDNDGTGFGYMFEMLEYLPHKIRIPVIVSGGAGNWHHLHEGLLHTSIDAVATANLFNFIGKGFPCARENLLNNGIELARW